jgi:hypothetical protein
MRRLAQVSRVRAEFRSTGIKKGTVTALSRRCHATVTSSPNAVQSETAGKVKENDPDLAMPTPLSMGFDIKYHPAKEGIPSAGQPRRPLAVLAGWMGAKERQLKPYMQFYHKRGIDTLSFAVGPKHILFPQNATKQMQQVW